MLNRKHNPPSRKALSVSMGVFLFIALLSGVWVLPTGAVDKGKVSHTAEAVCAFRSIGALDPDPKTRNPDHMAKSFLNPELYRTFPGLGLDFDDAKIAMNRMNTGVFYWINARTHHMDLALHQALASGFRQVIILGAGFDTRAYRFRKAFPDVRFFEVDLPATSMSKQQRVEKLLGRPPSWVTYVPIDFNTQTLNHVLAQAGYDPAQKTFYLWEGVTYYISETGVQNTLSFVAEHSAPGSQIIFDYMLEDVVKGLDYTPFGARLTVFLIANVGEPYVFGIHPDALETYINRHGLSLISNVGPTELTQRYLIHSNGALSGRMAEFMHIAHAQVPGMTQRARIQNQSRSHNSPAADKNNPHHPHAVKVPEDVQAFIKAHARNLKNKDFEAIAKQHSEQFLAYGHNKQQSITMLHRVYRNQPIHNYEMVITRFQQKGGNRAKIDGYAQRNGFRTPVMITEIIKESDGQWRWYGNQQNTP